MESRVVLWNSIIRCIDFLPYRTTTITSFTSRYYSFVIFVLHLSDIAPQKYRTVAIFVVDDLLTTYRTRRIDVFIFYLCIRFYVAKSNSSLVIIMNPNAEEKFIGRYVILN
jgi:hypothetical protein